ncbi:MAG: permease [Candidatus Omnitrophica bacterium]|nr:permease [Candidatus Omnitrophota bacterium]
MTADRRDPVCGMTGVLERYGRWFCSEGCAAEYARRSGAPARPSLWRSLRDPWVWVPASMAALAFAGLWWPAVKPVSDIYRGYLRVVWIPLLAGLVLGGLIDHFVPREYITRLLTGPRKRVIGRATVLGFLASTCSHGCLALSLELYRKGASTPAVAAFLLASPWASMALTFILLSLFGVKGLLIIAASLGIAFATGLIFQRVLAPRGLIEVNPHTTEVPEGFSIRADVARRLQGYRLTRAGLAEDVRGVVAGMIPLGRMVLGWVQFGLILSALAGGLVPHGVFERWLGPTPLGLLATLLIASIIEVCSEGTAPMAFELYRHTGALGNAFAMLMGGVVTDYTELGAVWRAIGRRTVLWILLVTLPMVALVGLLLNVL